jgi:hypothetical protein
MAEDLDQQEQQDPGGDGVEERLGPQAPDLHPAEGQTQVDGEPGDGAEQDRLGGGHGTGPPGSPMDLGRPKPAT